MCYSEQEEIQFSSKIITETENVLPKSHMSDTHHHITVSETDSLTPIKLNNNTDCLHINSTIDCMNENEEETRNVELKYLKKQIEYFEFRKKDLEGVVSNRILKTVQIISDDKIIVPVIPLSATSRQNDDKNCDKDTDSATCTIDRNNHMRCSIFDKVIGPDDAANNDLLRKIIKSAPSCLKGCNLGIIVYGSQQSKKSFTMFGKPNEEQMTVHVNNDMDGVMYNITNVLLAVISQQKMENWNYTVRIRILPVQDNCAKDVFREVNSTLIKTVKSYITDDNKEENEQNWIPTSFWKSLN
ncbi:unnamed protein product [Heterobilharzia americana]|nr:unnamed protein product [Heterobilharzia americana]